MRFIVAALTATLTLSACGGSDTQDDEVIRGLKAMRITEEEDAISRRYPSIVQPAEETKLSFEVGGRLLEIDLEVGQQVAAGQVLAEVDDRTLQLQRDQAQAGLDEAQSAYRNAKADYDRNKTLLDKDIISPAAMDRVRSTLEATTAQVEQAQKSYNIAEEDLGKAQLKAPFEGTVSNVEVESFTQVSPGQTVLTLYSESGYELRFSVPGTVVNALDIGDAVTINVPDLPGITLEGGITELGARAEQVSSFPVVVSMPDAPEDLRAGMAAEVELSLDLPGESGVGLLVPLSALTFMGEQPTNSPYERTGGVFVYDSATETVAKRQVTVGGIKGNMALVSTGLSSGEIVAVAGVSYLRDGQQVFLLPLEN